MMREEKRFIASKLKLPYTKAGLAVPQERLEAQAELHSSLFSRHRRILNLELNRNCYSRDDSGSKIQNSEKGQSKCFVEISGIMEEDQFQRLLEMFPIVRSRSYCADDAVGTSRRVPPGYNLASSNDELQQALYTESNSEQTETDKSMPQMSLASLHSKGNFWDQLKAAAEQQLLPEAAQKFCDAFRACHNEMVNNTLSLDGIERIAKYWPPPTK